MVKKVTLFLSPSIRKSWNESEASTPGCCAALSTYGHLLYIGMVGWPQQEKLRETLEDRKLKFLYTVWGENLQEIFKDSQRVEAHITHDPKPKPKSVVLEVMAYDKSKNGPWRSVRYVFDDSTGQCLRVSSRSL